MSANVCSSDTAERPAHDNYLVTLAQKWARCDWDIAARDKSNGFYFFGSDWRRSSASANDLYDSGYVVQLRPASEIHIAEQITGEQWLF